MHFQGVDHPGPTAVSAQGGIHGEQHLGSVPLTDHGFVLCVRNIANETVAVRIEVWGSNDFDVTDFNTQPGEYRCCKIGRRSRCPAHRVRRRDRVRDLLQQPLTGKLELD